MLLPLQNSLAGSPHAILKNMETLCSMNFNAKPIRNSNILGPINTRFPMFIFDLDTLGLVALWIL